MGVTINKFNSDKRRSNSALTSVEISIISSIIIVLGIFLLYVANTWYFGSMIEATEEVNENVEIIRSALMIEQIIYDYDRNTANLSVRNVAKDNLDLKIIAVELLAMDNRLIGRSSFSDLNYILQRGQRLDLVNVPTCIQCYKGELLKYRVWYVSRKHADDPSSMFGKAVFAEASFIYSQGELYLPCPPPSDYVMIDIVDPILLTNGEFTSSNTIKIRPAIKLPSPTIADITVYVESLNEGRIAIGSKRNVPVPSTEEVDIIGPFQGIKTPFKISISVFDPGTGKDMAIQREWVISGIPDRVVVNGITLLWREMDYAVHTVVVEISAPSPPDNVKVRISVKIKDCLGNELAEVEASEDIPSGEEFYSPIFIRLPKPIRFDQVYSIETGITEVE